MFSIPTGLEEFKTLTERSQLLWICVGGNDGQGNQIITATTSFSKNFLSKMFSVCAKTNSQYFHISSVGKEHFQEAPFSCQISVDDNCSNEAAFSNSSGIA